MIGFIRILRDEIPNENNCGFQTETEMMRILRDMDEATQSCIYLKFRVEV